MSVANGQPANSTTFNNAFISKTVDSTTAANIELADASVIQGTSVAKSQREFNSLNSFVGKSINTAKDALPSWSSNETGSPTDNLKNRIEAHDVYLGDKFDLATGHNHDGSAGNGQPIAAANIISVPLAGYFERGTDLTGVTGTSKVVTTEMTGKTPSSGSTVAGVVVTGSYNKVVLRNTNNDAFEDGSGNVVYGRLTESSGVWTLSFYSEPGGTETAYSFSSSTVYWYYQELFNPLLNPPVYSELAVIPSDNATQDVIDATSSLRGKVQLASSAAASVGSSSTAGTANATVANADHVHQGIHAIQEFTEAVDVYGDIILKGTGSTTVTRSGQTFTINTTVPASSPTFEYRTISAGEESAKQLTLGATPATANKTILDVRGAGAQFYTDDYTVSGAVLSWSGLGLDGVLTAGDKVRITYYV